jgi:hydroxymethylpyrimidine/phosphomethylpyrimidine kinase
MPSIGKIGRICRKKATVLKALSSPSTKLRCVLAIAGSDSSGGAGIQADLRTFAALGVHGLSAITAITAQSSKRVTSIRCVSPSLLRDQIESVFEEFDVAAVKIGMLGSIGAIRIVADVLEDRAVKKIVLDPVLVSSSGTPLLPHSAIKILRDRLIPLVEVLTPNRPETAVLLGRTIAPKKAALAMLNFGAGSVLLKGGHARGPAVVDHFADANGSHDFSHERLPIRVRGTGCTLASAIAANLAKGMSRLAAVREAERFLQRALRRSRLASDSNARVLLSSTISKKT